MITAGILLFTMTPVFGLYEVSVSEVEAKPEHHTCGSMESMYECISPLYQTAHPQRYTFITTTSIEEVVKQVTVGGHAFRGILGRVAVKKEGCECKDGTELIPAHLMMKDNTFDYFLVADNQEMEGYKSKGYVDRGVNFWCSPEKDKCGASLTLFRHTNIPNAPFHHTYTTNEKQTFNWNTNGWKKDGQVCYIWPTQYNRNNFDGEN